MPAPRSLILEGWRRLPHSYAHIHRMQALALRLVPGLSVFCRDLPVPLAHWRERDGLLSPGQQSDLDAIPFPPPGLRADAVLRLSWPPDLAPAADAERTFVFVTSEQGYPPEGYFAPGTDLAMACRDPRLRLITPSAWSRDGFLRAGVPAASISIVPHGVDPALFFPLSDADRAAARTALGLSGSPVFLNVSAMTPNKGIDILVAAFAVVLPAAPGARLILKGLDDIYGSSIAFAEAIAALPPAPRAAVESRTTFIPTTLPAAELARWFQAADAYVSPSVAEGFNIPALEAAACGCVVLATSGLPTDDFLKAPFLLRIRSRLFQDKASPRRQFEPDIGHLAELMLRIAREPGLLRAARSAGPAHVRANYTWSMVADRLLRVMGFVP